ncbi:hypothetical protein V6N12_065435 [Hibiscus sabdariffa]|uniref:Uncharacterized protein n=1 Tax=Hibiscus sabdariffa TaxID=183260 RepID=A0ABR2G960_9ROSI
MASSTSINLGFHFLVLLKTRIIAEYMKIGILNCRMQGNLSCWNAGCVYCWYCWRSDSKQNAVNLLCVLLALRQQTECSKSVVCTADVKAASSAQ